MIGARKVMRGKGVSRKTRSGDEIIKNQSIRAASKRRTFTSALVIFLIAALFLTGTVWGTISFIDANSLRIYINRRNVGTISLSESEDFNSPTSVIRMQGPEQMTNTTYEWIEQAASVLGREGNHHEENVIAYSFYLRNMGETAIYYTSTIVLNQLSRDVENALRIIVVEEADPGSDVEAAPEEGGGAADDIPEEAAYKATCYAMPYLDAATGEMTPEAISYADLNDDRATQTPFQLRAGTQLDDLLGESTTTPFLGFVDEEDDEKCVVFEHTDLPLAPGEVKKFTVLVWVEGTDADCVDAIKSAYVNFEFMFEVTDENADIA